MDVDDDDDKGLVTKKRRGGKSILSRVGGRAAASGVTLTIKNLKFSILESEVKELFATVSRVLSAKIIYDRTGRSTGVAEVTLENRKAANDAIKQYNGRTLDGRAMDIEIKKGGVVEDGKKGLFGSALRDTHDSRR